MHDDNERGIDVFTLYEILSAVMWSGACEWPFMK
jgi:hypothetical protein